MYIHNLIFLPKLLLVNIIFKTYLPTLDKNVIEISVMVPET